MASIRLLLVGMLAVAALAGCASNQTSSLDSVFGSGNITTATLPPMAGLNVTNVSVIAGTQLEARLNDGAWGNASASIMVPAIAGAKMSGPSAQGGGGESTPLSVPGNATLEVRFVKHDQLAGYTAWWYFVAGNSTPQMTKAPATDAFETALPTGGAYEVHAILSANGDDPSAVIMEPATGKISVHWTITGQVQPMRVPDPTGAGVVPSGSRDSMVDKYTLTLPAGVPVKATSTFDGTYTQSDGTDVDLGVYGVDGAGVVCSGTGGGALPVVGTNPAPSPTQADETVTTTTTDAGSWSVQVGAMADGCGGTNGWQYTNAGPVPYKVDIVVG